jgi:hypothetical protein
MADFRNTAVRANHTQAFGDTTGDYFAYTHSGTSLVNDRVYMGTIPAGVDVYNMEIRVPTGDNVVGLSLNVGHERRGTGSPANSATSFFSAQSVAAAGSFNSNKAIIRCDDPIDIWATLQAGTLANGNKLLLVWSGKMIGAV